MDVSCVWGQYQADPWSRGREVARGVQCSSLKPGKGPIFCHRRGIEIFCRLFSTQQRPNVFVSEASRRPPPITRRFVNTVTRGWVGAPNGRATFTFHGAVVVFVARCPGLAISPLRTKIWLSFSQADLGRRSAHELLFSGSLTSLNFFFKDLRS